MHNLYLIPLMSSIPVFSAINSELKVEVSTLFCFFEYRSMGALLRYNRMPVQDRRVTRSPAWSASTKQVICTPLLHGGGMLGGSSSCAPG